ncbi:hypothetical protein MOD54_12405 [Bacillus spizizenii]|nr:hypothetical protein [Bacillus spizizenii]MCY8110274.1 hypothetical protein [Bacillus spizizenii]MCY8303412.1 hypothetical protein [Bacillus spizizenii]MCY8659726.1 hypothetical protein [Bacillus spizizenii]MCY8687357.1 hypothetical protein [Bacillus spizizenii]
MDRENRKQIGVVHLVYILIISILIITFISIIAFGGGKEAGNQMNVAATAVSIILAVIAILMTLVDVAGQRQSITDLKDVGEQLEISTQSANKMFEEAINAVSDFQNAKTDLMDSFTETISRLEEIKQGDTEKINEVIVELKEKQAENISKYANGFDWIKDENKKLKNYSGRTKKELYLIFRILNSFNESAVEYDKFVGTFDVLFGQGEAKKIIDDLIRTKTISKGSSKVLGEEKDFIIIHR